MSQPTATPARPPRYAKKSDWASAKALALRAEAEQLRLRSSAGSTFKARQKYESVDLLHREATRYERMAARFRLQGN